MQQEGRPMLVRVLVQETPAGRGFFAGGHVSAEAWRARGHADVNPMPSCLAIEKPIVDSLAQSLGDRRQSVPIDVTRPGRTEGGFCGHPRNVNSRPAAPGQQLGGRRRSRNIHRHIAITIRGCGDRLCSRGFSLLA